MKRKRWSFRVVLAATAGGAVVAACASEGSVGAPVRRDRGGAAPLVPDAAAEPSPFACEVEAGSSCLTATERVCERGAHAAPFCNEVLRCVGTSWERTSGGACASACPAAYSERAPGACDAARAETLLCEYPEGTCGCAPVDAHDEHGPDDEEDAGDELDAGARDAGAEEPGPARYEWRCVRPAAGCPRTRPRLGDRCVTPMTCDYGVCVFEHGALVRCASGRWDAESVPRLCRF
ncbi:MAG: hypothetical protein KF764_21765 [Labilithrix sp.]|nr:hypothetical protein [Labilithrix sp.]